MKPTIGVLGLRYDDLYDDMYDLDIKEALNRLPQQEVDYRNQRLKRAMDYSLKHQYLPKDLQVLFLACYLHLFCGAFGAERCVLEHFERLE